MMGMDFAFEFTFALTIHTGKDVQAVSRKSRIGIAAKSAFSIISTVARINNGGDVEMTCIWLTFAVRTYDLTVQWRTTNSTAGLTTRSVVRGAGFGNLRRTTGIYCTLIPGMRSCRVLLKTCSAGNDGLVRAIAFGYD